MKFFTSLTITACFCLLPLFSEAVMISKPKRISTATWTTHGNTDMEKSDKEKVLEDARKLREEFKNLFKDLTELSKNSIDPLTSSISEWITSNYAELSEKQRQKVKEFLGKLKKEYENVEKMSLETVKEMLNNFKKFLRQLQEGEKFDDPLTRT